MIFDDVSDLGPGGIKLLPIWKDHESVSQPIIAGVALLRRQVTVLPFSGPEVGPSFKTSNHQTGSPQFGFRQRIGHLQHSFEPRCIRIYTAH